MPVRESTITLSTCSGRHPSSSRMTISALNGARERLATHPDEALKWYNRARYALDAEDSPIASEIRHRHDVLAVWEYLERTLPLAKIVRVFEHKS